MFIFTEDMSFLLQDSMIALLSYVFLYLIYFFGSDLSFVKKWRGRFKEDSANFEASVYFRRTLGFILLGLIPFLIALFAFDRNIGDYGVLFPSGAGAIWWAIIPFVLIVGVSIIRPSKKIDIGYYPEVRKNDWPIKRRIINALFWSLYLLGYEFALRGFVFFSSVYAFGLWPAIVINSVIYGLIHIFKGRQEAFGAVFLGVLFCLITYYTNSFWIAFVIHALMAIINDIKAVNAAKAKNSTITI